MMELGWSVGSLTQGLDMLIQGVVKVEWFKLNWELLGSGVVLTRGYVRLSQTWQC